VTLTRLLIVDDHQSIRDFLSAAFGFEDDMEIVGAASDAYEGVAEALRTQPDVVLLDYQLPGRTGSEAIPMFREAAPHCKVILYSAVLDLGGLPSDSPRPDVYLRKGVDPDLIVATIRMLA
jgi:DNA-binding NarL/FixJ family response regulator